MKFISENFRDLHQLYVHELRVLLSAEEQIVRALPDMVIRATDDQLRGAFKSHLQETEAHVTRLKEILAQAKAGDTTIESVDPVKCKAITAMIEETNDSIVDARDAFVRDVALIAAAQRVEHYEIASYGTVRHFAQVLSDTLGADLLDKTIKEEGHADHLLTSIAERINPYAKRAA